MAEKVIDSLANRILELEPDRFVDVDNTDTNEFVEQLRNVNTRKMTESHIRLLRQWLEKQKNEQRLPEEIPAAELDVLLAQFFLSVRKNDSTGIDLDDPRRQYEPQTLIAMHSSFHRYLGSKSYVANIKQDRSFLHSRDVLSAKMKQLKQLGKGNKPNAAQPFTEEELQICINEHLLGTANPKALINTLWLNCTMHFGLRGRHEHTQMLWGDLQLQTDASGKEYVEFSERSTKTRQGTSCDTRPFAPKMYATGCEQCPVKVFKEYAKRRPSDCCDPQSRFYLTPQESNNVGVVQSAINGEERDRRHCQEHGG